MKVKGCRIVNIPTHVEIDGTLLVVESGSEEIPFKIERLFWVKNVAAGKSRGDHATKITNLILVPMSGSLDVLVDDGIEKDIVHLDNPSKGLYIDAMIWRSMFNFSSDAVVLAIADQKFQPGNETYDDYKEFINTLGV